MPTDLPNIPTEVENERSGRITPGVAFCIALSLALLVVIGLAVNGII